MFDIFETIFIWGLYVILPAALINYFLGPQRTSLLFAGMLALSQPNDNELNRVNFPFQLEKNNPTLLVRNPQNNSMETITNKRKFDLTFHRKLEKHFPDWEDRMNFQKKQENFYKSAMKKQAELRRTRMIDMSNRYTKEELDAVSYFQGTGFYAKQQDPSENPKPCIYDTRQTFLIKMHDNDIRRNVLKSFNFPSKGRLKLA